MSASKTPSSPSHTDPDIDAITARLKNAMALSVESTQIPVTVSLMTGESLEVLIRPDASVDDLRASIARTLNTSPEAFDSHFHLTHGDRELRDGAVGDNGIVAGSRLALTPRISTGLRSIPTSTAEVSRNLQSLIGQAINSSAVASGEPLTFYTRIGGQEVSIQITPVSDREKQQQQQQQKTSDKAEEIDFAKLTPEQQQQLLQRLFFERLDKANEEERQRKARDADNKKLESKIEALKERMKRRKLASASSSKQRKEVATSSAVAATVPASVAPSRPVKPVTGFAGLRRGFLLK